MEIYFLKIITNCLKLLHTVSALGIIVMLQAQKQNNGTFQIHHNYQLNRRHFNNRYINPILYLKRVICLGNEAEAVEAVCCAEKTEKPWLIILPTRHAVECNQPDCAFICKSAIMASRYKRQTTRSSMADYKHSFVRERSNGSKVNNNSFLNNFNETSRGINSMLFNAAIRKQTVLLPVPKIVLELLALCRNINKSELNNNKELKSMCETTNISIKDLFDEINGKQFNMNSFSTTGKEDEFANRECDDSECCPTCPSSCSEMKSCENYSISSNDDFNLCTFQLEPNIPGSTCPYYRTEPYEKKQSNETNTHERFLLTSSKSPRTNNGKLSPFFELITGLPTPQEYSPNNFKQNVSTYDEKSSEPSRRSTNSPVITIPNFSCNCSKKTRTTFGKNKVRNLLLAVISVPKPCQTLPHKLNNTHGGKYEEDAGKEVYKGKEEIYKNSNTESSKSIKGFRGGSVEVYISYVNNAYMDVYRDYKLSEWNYETNMTYNTRKKAMESTMELSIFQRSIPKSLDSLRDIPHKDTNLERQIKLLQMDGINVLPAVQNNEFEQVMYAMQTIYSSATVNKWKGGSERVGLDPEISQVMAYSNDPEELKYYWSEWRNATGRRIRVLFEQYVSLMNSTAKENGFHDASEMWDRHFESEDFIDSLSSNWEEIKPLYKELHAYVRHELHNFYGDIAGAKDAGTIPAHFTGDIWSKNWVNLYHKVSPYKEKSSLMDTILSFHKKKPDPKIIARTVEKSFRSLGFSKLPDSFWINSIFEKRNDSVMSCEPSAWDMFNGTDIRIKLCANRSLEDMFTIYHQIAICEYYKECRRQPFIFRNEAAPGFYEGISGAILLSVKTHSHIKKLKLPHSTPTEESEINKLVNLALDKVAFLPYSYILDLWRHKVFRGEIDLTDYNVKWWELRSRYQGISPPSERTENDFDIGSKLHVVTNKPYIKYFVGTLLQFQIHEALCKRAKHKGKIHKCDFTNSPAVGKILRKVMGIGSSKHWRSTLQEMTGVRRLESAPLLRYFQPLYNWLKEKNKESKIVVGWNE